MNGYISEIEKDYNRLNKLHEIAIYINQEFDRNYLPEISLTLECEKIQSVIISLKYFLSKLRERLKISNRFYQFLYNNKLSNEKLDDLTMEKLKENVNLYHSNYPNYVEKLKKIYHPKFDKLSDVSSILHLSERSEVPFIAAHDFLKNLKPEVKDLSKDDIRKKRLQFYQCVN